MNLNDIILISIAIVGTIYQVIYLIKRTIMNYRYLKFLELQELLESEEWELIRINDIDVREK